MAVTWTEEQKKVIDTRNQNLLVSAAAGSGKTAVLVERILERITDKEQPVDIDRLLVVTFTKAAAAEMRERIAKAIEIRRENNPEDERLERQQTLIYHAQICTIDSFCLFVVRNHFQEIGLDPNFRIADPGEIQLLEEDVRKEVFESFYRCEDPNTEEAFLQLIDTYSGNRSDKTVQEMVAQIYRLSESQPWPKAWIESLTESYRMESPEELNHCLQGVADIVCMQIRDNANRLEAIRKIALQPDGPQLYAETLDRDLEQLYAVLDKENDYDSLALWFSAFEMGSIATIRKYTGDEGKKEKVKEIRNQVKKELETIRKNYFSMSVSDLFEQMQKLRPYVEMLVEISLCYHERMDARKREMRIVDFSDIEHMALQILVDEKTGERRPAALEFQRQFEEIMLDEYQDSNAVQEAIMQAIARKGQDGNNMFMVGDVKQSIYRFRLARPELFMEKYHTFPTKGETGNLRIDLHRNFRSRYQVLSFVNDIFYKIMQADLGNVAYDKDAALYYGANYPEAEDMEAEILIYDKADLPETSNVTSEDTEEGMRRKEARMIAARIRRLMETGQVTDAKTGQLRPVQYRDIVILLRSIRGTGNEISEILESFDIPVHVESSTGYFSATEVRIVLSMLQILDNPYQDIPMTAVLKSPIVGLTEEDLAQIRLNHPDVSFAEAVCMELEETQEEPLASFGKLYRQLRRRVCDTPIHTLIQIFLRESGYAGYVAAMPAGAQRSANLDMLVEKAISYEKTSYKGLFHFIRYIEQLHQYDVDYGEANDGGENADVVRIMTIHKSKGLEFPIVFVSGLSKKFNETDLSKKLVLHADLGMGLYEISGTPRRRRPNLYRTQMIERLRRENHGEELRVLYVAMTRAKEKLILTGTVNDWDAYRRRFTGNVKKEISFSQRDQAKCYLDWITPALLSYPDKYEVQLYGNEDLILSETHKQAQSLLQRQELLAQMEAAPEERVEEIRRLFSYVYPYQQEIDRKSKYSVSEIKHRRMQEEYERQEMLAELPDFLKEEHDSYIPEFAGKFLEIDQEKEKAIPGVSQGALRGTAVHRVMECLDFAAIADLDCCDDALVHQYACQQLRRQLEAGMISEEMYALVAPSVIEGFVKDPVSLRMAQAQLRGELFKEKPFVMEQEGVLIQGIIDVFWIEDEKIVLLDYKTDRVETRQELEMRYREQLFLYAEALTRSFSANGKKIKAVECMIYSFRLKEGFAL